MQDIYTKSLKEGLTELEGLDRDYLEASRRRLFLMPEAEREAVAEEHKRKAALYFELYRTAQNLSV
ncbi:MAG: hypothetical protein AAF564_10540 [Bacteroidota bacterium]